MSREEPTAISRMTRGFVVLLCVTLVGIAGYLVTGWSLLDAVYMVVITIFGVGYGEVRHVDSTELKLFTMGLIISGCSALIYILGGFFQLIAEGELNRALGKLRMTKQIKKLEGHVIICGYGRIGRVLAEDLHRANVEVVVVDTEESRATRASEEGCLVFQGDASHDATLRSVGIDRARALCAVLPSDAMNVFVTLTARNLSPTVPIIARGEDPETEPKLRHAGANRVVLPSAISASQMADMVTRPEVMDYLKKGDMSGLDADLKVLGLSMNPYPLDETAAGRVVGDIERQARVSLMVVALKRASGETIERPSLDVPLEPGDRVILITHDQDAHSISLRFAEKAKRVSYRGATLQR